MSEKRGQKRKRDEPTKPGGAKEPTPGAAALAQKSDGVVANKNPNISKGDDEAAKKGKSMWKSTAYFDYPPGWMPPEFDFNTEYWNPDETVFWLGTRGSGKTIGCAFWCLKWRKAYGSVFCMSNTTINNFWQQFIPADKVLQGWDEDLAMELIDLCEQHQRNWLDNKEVGPRYNMLVCEDLIDSKLLRTSKAARRILFNGRHAGLSCHILSQDYTGLDRGQRDNIDRMFIFRTTDVVTREGLVRQWGPGFLEMLDRVTENPNRVVVINNRKRIPKDQMITYMEIDKSIVDRARKNPTGVLGNKLAWGDIDPAEQRKDLPFIEKKQTYETMKRQWNAGAEEISEDSEGDQAMRIHELKFERSEDEEMEGEEEEKSEVDSDPKNEKAQFKYPRPLRKKAKQFSSAFVNWW